MKKNKDRKRKIAEWFKETDWSSVGLIGALFLVLVGIFGYVAYVNEKEKQKSTEEKLRIEEFTYKGHKYIKFKGNDLLGTGSVVHDPDCDCQIKRNSI